MATIGSQSPQGPQGPQGPYQHLELAAGLQSKLWGPQGPPSDGSKEDPFYGDISQRNITSARLELRYTCTSGQVFSTVITRAISSEADLLTYLPDDLVQMINITDFRPHTGFYRTTFGGASNAYRVLEVTNFPDPIGALIDRQSVEPVYIANETGL